MSYIFGGNTGQTYQGMQRQRDLAKMLLERSNGMPKTAIEGANMAIDDIVGMIHGRRADAAHKAGRDAFGKAARGVFGNNYGMGEPTAPEAPTDPYAAPSVPGEPAASPVIGAGDATVAAAQAMAGAQTGTNIGNTPPGEPIAPPPAPPPAPAQAKQVAANYNPQELFALMTNDFATPEEKRFIAGWLQQSMAPPDPMDALELERAQLEINALRNPARKMYEAADGRKYWLDTNELVNPDVVPKEDGPLIVNKTESGFDMETGKNLSAILDEFHKTANSSYTALGNLGVMEDLLESGLKTGWGAEFKTAGAKALAAAGFNVDIGQIENMEAFNSQVSQAILDAAGGSLGAQVSDSDRQIFERRTAQLSNTPGGNRKIIEIAKRVHQRNIAVARMAREYMAGPGNGRLDYGFYDVLGEYAKNNSIFDGIFDDGDGDRARLNELREKAMQ